MPSPLLRPVVRVQSVVGVWASWSAGPVPPFSYKESRSCGVTCLRLLYPGSQPRPPAKAGCQLEELLELGGEPGAGGVGDLRRLGSMPPPSTVFTEPLCSLRLLYQEPGLWAGPAGSCRNSCVHLLNLMLLQQACQTPGSQAVSLTCLFYSLLWGATEMNQRALGRPADGLPTPSSESPVSHGEVQFKVTLSSSVPDPELGSRVRFPVSP